MNGRFRILARIPKGQGEPEDVVKSKTTTSVIYTCNDPDVDWYKANVPCRQTCPAHTRIPEYIDASARGDYSKCYEINRQDNVLPHILGRVCAHPCESVCRHGYGGMGEPVSICWLKRSGADFKIDTAKLPIAKPTGKRVAVIGSGPAGLASAQDLTMWGHKVTLMEGMDKPGGMLRYGIPRFRLPAELIDFEIAQVLDLGVELKCGEWIENQEALKKLANEYDAVIMAAGSMKPVMLGIDGEDADRVVSGLQFMKEINNNELTKMSGHVMVLGGGFTAMDCARSAWRIGADRVTIVYRRSRNELKVDERELKETAIEGVTLEYLMSPVEIKKTSYGAVKEIVMRRNALGKAGSDGRRSISPIEGSERSIEVDWLVPAISQTPDTSLFEDNMAVDVDYQTQIDKVFATGDYITGPKDIITAIGNAHKTCREVDKFLMGEERFKEVIEKTVWEQRIPDSYKGWKSIEGNIFDLVPRLEMPSIEVSQRKSMVKEVDTGYQPKDTYWQGERCYLCNHNIEIDQTACILCYNCVDVCPYEVLKMLRQENVMVDGGDGAKAEDKNHTYMVLDEEKCVRCGLCIDACPVPCLTMEKMEVTTELKV